MRKTIFFSDFEYFPLYADPHVTENFGIVSYFPPQADLPMERRASNLEFLNRG